MTVLAQTVPSGLLHIVKRSVIDTVAKSSALCSAVDIWDSVVPVGARGQTSRDDPWAIR